MNKQGIEMGFSWIFAIIVGVVILFLAIYTTTRIIGTSRYELDTETAKKISILIDPLETSLGETKAARIRFPVETRMFNQCFQSGNFGRQELSFSSKSGLGNKWQEAGGDTTIRNKYIFSKSVEEGQESYVFSNSFDMPFKVADIVVFSSSRYCFIQTPNQVKEDVEKINLGSIRLADFPKECGDGEETVCFAQFSECDINVQATCVGCDNIYDSGFVEKKGDKIYYNKGLMYAAILSDKELYECNVKRLMLRLSQVALLYKDKSEIASKQECRSNLESNLIGFAGQASNLEDSSELILIEKSAESIKKINDAAFCKLF